MTEEGPAAEPAQSLGAAIGGDAEASTDALGQPDPTLAVEGAGGQTDAMEAAWEGPQAERAATEAAAEDVKMEEAAPEPAAEEGAEAKAEEGVEVKAEEGAEVKAEEGVEVKAEEGAEVKAEEGGKVQEGEAGAGAAAAAAAAVAAPQGDHAEAAVGAAAPAVGAAAEAPKQEQEAAEQEGEGEGEDGAAAAPQPPSDEQLVGRLRALLQEADLSTVTERSLRRALESEFKLELAAKKPLIRAEIEKFLAEQEDGEEEQQGDGEAAEEEEGDEGEVGASRTSAKKRRRSGGAALGSRLSPELAAFLGMDTCPRPQVVKLLWAYIKEHDLQDPSDKRRILLDDKLKTIFPGKSTDMFKMNKHLSKHCKVDDRDPVSEDEEEEEGGGSEEGSGDEEGERQPKRARAAAAKKAPPRKKKASGGGASGEKKPNGFQKPVRVSDEMAAWCGKSEISRPELTKFFYAYVKENNLHDPDNKQFVLSDPTLKALTGESRIRAFGFQSLIKQHFIRD